MTPPTTASALHTAACRRAFLRASGVGAGAAAGWGVSS